MSTDETSDDDAVSNYTYIHDIYYDTAPAAASVHSYMYATAASICSYAAVGSASDVYMVASNNGVYVENPQIANLSDE